MNQRIAAAHHLARTQLAGLAQFSLPVDLHRTGGHQRLRSAAAACEAGDLQQGVQRDVIAAQFEVELAHRSAVASSTTSEAAWATQGSTKPCAFSSASRPGHSMR